MKRQEGFVLIEMAIAILIMGILAASYFTAQATAFKSSFFIKEKANALNLVQSENFSGDNQYPGVIGYVHKQTFNQLNSTNTTWWYWVTSSSSNKSANLSFTPALLSSTYAGYTVNVTAARLGAPYDDNIQQITVVIAHARPEGRVDIVRYVGYNTNMGTR